MNNQLRSILDVLSSNSDSQLKFLELERLPEVVDELGLLFDDVYMLMPRFKREGSLNKEQIIRIDEIDSILDSISGLKMKEYWTPHALANFKE